jgi:hypothetical protein
MIKLLLDLLLDGAKDKMKKHIDLNTLILLMIGFGTWTNYQSITAVERTNDSIKAAMYYKFNISVPSNRDNQSHHAQPKPDVMIAETRIGFKQEKEKQHD